MIYFLSDAHLGSLAIERGYAQQKKLIALLEEMSKDAVSVYMLGDMFDFWMEYFISDKSKRQYHPFCKQLRKMAKKGIHIHMFVGNHDLWTFGGLARLTGAEIHYEPTTIIRYGNGVTRSVTVGRRKAVSKSWQTPVRTKASAKRSWCSSPKIRRNSITTAIIISSVTAILNSTCSWKPVAA